MWVDLSPGRIVARISKWSFALGVSSLALVSVQVAAVGWVVANIDANIHNTNDSAHSGGFRRVSYMYRMDDEIRRE